MQVQCELGKVKIGAGFSELLTKLVLEMSSLLHLSQKIVVNHAKNSQMLQGSLCLFDEKVKKGLFWRAAAKEQPFQVDQILGNSNILKRFACRIMEVLIPFKQRADTEPLQIFVHLSKLISNLQSSVYILQQSSSIQPFAAQICQALLAFISPFSRKVTKKLSLQEHSSSSPYTTDLKNFSSSNRDQPEPLSNTQPEYNKKFKKLLGGINARFKTLDCMDLEYSEFRSAYFQAISKEGLFDSYFKRNESISNQIDNYSKKYKEQSLGKKAKRRYRNDLSYTKIDSADPFKQSKQKQKNTVPLYQSKIGVKVNNWANQKERIVRFPSKKFSLGDEISLTEPIMALNESKQKILRKTKYEIKNVIITASKIKLQPCQSTRKQNMKTTLKHFQISRRKTLRDGDPLIRNLKHINLSLNK